MDLDYGKIKAFWKIRAQEAEKKQRAVNLGASEEQCTLQLQKLFSVIEPADQNIIDLGCGTGRLALPLAEAGKQVVATDYIESLLDQINQEASQKGLKNIETVCAPCYEKLPVAYGTFDIALISGLMIYLNDPELDRLITNAAELIRPRGKIIVRESIGTQGRFEVDRFSEELKADYQAIYRTTSEIEELFQAKGLYSVHSEKLYQQRKETGTWFWVFNYRTV